MDWSDLLAERVLGERGEELLKEFLRAAIPEFQDRKSVV